MMHYRSHTSPLGYLSMKYCFAWSLCVHILLPYSPEMVEYHTTYSEMLSEGLNQSMLISVKTCWLLSLLCVMCGNYKHIYYSCCSLLVGFNGAAFNTRYMQSYPIYPIYISKSKRWCISFDKRQSWEAHKFARACERGHDALKRVFPQKPIGLDASNFKS